MRSQGERGEAGNEGKAASGLPKKNVTLEQMIVLKRKEGRKSAENLPQVVCLKKSGKENKSLASCRSGGKQKAEERERLPRCKSKSEKGKKPKKKMQYSTRKKEQGGKSL